MEKIFFLGQKVSSLKDIHKSRIVVIDGKEQEFTNDFRAGGFFTVNKTPNSGGLYEMVSYTTAIGAIEKEGPDWKGTEEEAQAMFNPVDLSMGVKR